MTLEFSKPPMSYSSNKPGSFPEQDLPIPADFDRLSFATVTLRPAVDILEPPNKETFESHDENHAAQDWTLARSCHSAIPSCDFFQKHMNHLVHSPASGNHNIYSVLFGVSLDGSV